MAVPKKGEGWGLVGCSKDQGRGQGRVGLAVGGARASVAGARAPGTEQISQRVSYFCSNAQKEDGFF